MPISSWPSPPGGWPPNVLAVPYVGSAAPGKARLGSWLEGANCQLFAYGVLGLFGLACPALPSSKLWHDLDSTVIPEQPGPLDLVLFNATKDPWGAHLGVWMAPDEVFHLCKEVGAPVVWPMAEFSRRARYATTVGVKRVVRTVGFSDKAAAVGTRRAHFDLNADGVRPLPAS